MWSRIQTMQGVQLAGLAATYALRSVPIASLAVLGTTILLTCLVFGLLKRDALVQTQFLHVAPGLNWAVPRRWYAPLTGRETTWVLLVLLMLLDLGMGVVVIGQLL